MQGKNDPTLQSCSDSSHHPSPQQAITTALHPTTSPPARPSNDLPTPLVSTPPHLLTIYTITAINTYHTNRSISVSLMNSIRIRVH